MRILTPGRVLFLLLALCPAVAQEPARSEAQAPACSIDLRRVGQMEDVLSNVLMHALHKDGKEVRAALSTLRPRSETSDALVQGCARHFGLDANRLARLAQSFKHVNCRHDHPAKDFARAVTTHVVLHELGHALVREFDLPILGNEETLADAFATHYLCVHLPDQALEVLAARVRSLMTEAGEVPRAEWPVRGEHNHDARRAYQITALALAADAKKFAPLARLVAMSPKDQRSAVDYGAEIHRSWRRILRPLWMPAGQASKEVRVVVEAGSGLQPAAAWLGTLARLEASLRRFDWHSQIKLVFAAEGGGAGWSRSKRAITVSRSYVGRFVHQGMRLAAQR